jgi:hypothetical protein
MSERITRGLLAYRLRHADRSELARGRKLERREALHFVAGLSDHEVRVLERRYGDEARAEVAERIARGRVEVWLIEHAPATGERKERPELLPLPPLDVYSVAIELVDANDQPVPFEPYRIKLPDGQIQQRQLDAYGRDRVTGIREPGQCLVCFHRRDASVWARA